MGRMMGDQLALELSLEGQIAARGETADLVALAEGLANLPAPQIDETWASALEARLLNEGLETPAVVGRPSLMVVGEPQKTTEAAPVRRAPVVTLPRRRLVVRKSVAAVAAAAALAAFPVAAAASSLPESPFYSVKRFMERAEIALVGGSVHDAFTHLKHANVRLDEAEQMGALGYDDAAIAAVLADAEELVSKANALIWANTSDPATLERLAAEARAIEDQAILIGGGPVNAGALAPVIATSRQIQVDVAEHLGLPAPALVEPPEVDATTVTAPTTMTTFDSSSSPTSTGSQGSTSGGSSGGSTSPSEGGSSGPGAKTKGISGDESDGCEIPGSGNGFGDLMAPVTKVWCS
ncbi:MAG TPA: DUF5667 domain-containing protein [Actinomycetota bacterium]